MSINDLGLLPSGLIDLEGPNSVRSSGLTTGLDNVRRDFEVGQIVAAV